MIRRAFPVAFAVAAAALAGCVTIQVYFPAARIQSLTEKIEDEVQRRAQEQAPRSHEAEPATPPATAPPAETPSPKGVSPPRADLSLLELALGIRPAHADEGVPEPDVTSPAIRKLIESRAARVADLNRFRAAGAVGEGRDALLVIRALDAVADLAERAALKRLVDAENADRRLLFQEIAAAEGVDTSQLPRIQATYAQTLRRHARPGDWVQSADGSWAQATEQGR